MSTTELITAPQAPGPREPWSDERRDARLDAASAEPTVGETLDETLPLVGAIPVYGPPVVFLAGPWLFLALMLAGPFALLVTFVVLLAAAAALVGLIGADPRGAVSARPPPPRVPDGSRVDSRPRRRGSTRRDRGERTMMVSDTDATSFHTVRPRLFGIAYRVLGSATEADDVVQDAWIRWQRTDRSKVRDTAAFLATTTTRLAINVDQSARARHEIYVEPQPLEAIDTGADPSLGAEQREALELAVRTLLEKLSPTERAAYLLREAFDYPYRQIAEAPRAERGERQATRHPCPPPSLR